MSISGRRAALLGRCPQFKMIGSVNLFSARRVNGRRRSSKVQAFRTFFERIYRYVICWKKRPALQIANTQTIHSLIRSISIFLRVFRSSDIVSLPLHPKWINDQNRELFQVWHERLCFLILVHNILLHPLQLRIRKFCPTITSL